MIMEMSPVAFVKNTRENLSDDFWGNIVSVIELVDDIPSESLKGIEAFSHIEIIFHFHQASDSVLFSRHPRGNADWPEVGVFAQRNKDRPNRLGITVARLIKKEGRKLFVIHFDAINGTPVLDIKPVMKEFMIDKSEISQPKWADEMLTDYWKQ